MWRLVVFVCVWLGVLSAQAMSEEAQPDTPLTLQDALDIALSQHPTLRVGQAALEAAQQRMRQEITGYLPKGGYTYTYSRQQRPTSAAVGGVQVGEPTQRRNVAQIFNFNSTNFSISQLLFDFGRTLASIRAAAASVEASEADLDTTRQTVIFNTKQAYYALLSFQYLLKVAEETVQQNQKHLEEAQARHDVGVAPRFDVTQAQVQLSNAQLDLVTVRNNIALGRETLRTAMGITGPFNYIPVDALDRAALTLDEDELVALAHRRRPELRSISAQERAAEAQVSSLRRRYLPSISGGAQYSWTGREYPLQEGWLWSVTLTVPLFDSLLTTTQVGEAQANMRSLVAQGDDLRQQVVLEVRQGVLNVREAEERIRVSEITIVQATENLALAEGRYSAGVGNIIEVTDAQTSLTSARATHLQAQYNYKTALAQLEQAVGQPLE